VSTVPQPVPTQDQVVEVIVEEPSFGVWDFLANVGGVIGLYAGMSLITLLEVYTIRRGLRISQNSIVNCGFGPFMHFFERILQKSFGVATPVGTDDTVDNAQHQVCVFVRKAATSATPDL